MLALATAVAVPKPQYAAAAAAAAAALDGVVKVMQISNKSCTYHILTNSSKWLSTSVVKAKL